jgi:hypothetical protein
MSFTKLDTLPAWELATLGADGFTVAPKDGQAPVWSGRAFDTPPAIGERIKVRMNGLGHALVVGYFTEGGYLGVRVKYESPPEWFVRQNGGNVEGAVFGAEITTPDAPAKRLIDYHRAVVEAKALLAKARQARADFIVAKSPRRVGDVFDAGGQTWKAEKITPSEGGSEVYVFCRKLMSNKQWSRSLTPHTTKIEGWEEVVALNRESA